MIQPIISLLRFPQYIKNVFIFAPLFFAARFNESELILNSALAFVAFSLCASAVYIFNDYQDVEEDRLHDKKKLRPLASGQVSTSMAFALLCILVLGAFSLMLSLSVEASVVMALYLASNIAYSLKLKRIPIIDISIISLGFVLRLFVGALVCEIPLSHWIVIMTFLLALFLALAKRRDDVLIYTQTGQKMRKVIDGYNLIFVDIAMTIMSSVVIVVYLLYTTSHHPFLEDGNYLYLTTVFVIIGVLRYLQITLVEENSGSPTQIVLNDRFIQIIIFLWLASFSWVLYAPAFSF